MKRGNLLLYLCLLLVCSCTGYPWLETKEIRFPTEPIPSLYEGVVSPRNISDREDKEYCLIHYDASMLCGICLLRQYYLWDELILQLGEERIAYLFMLEPTENASYEKMAGALNERYFSRPVFLDQHGWFKNENGLNPRAGSLDILTDRNGKIILVGNLRNNHRFFYRIKRKIASKG